MSLANRVYFVTACTSELGRAIAFEIAAKGGHLVLTDEKRDEGNALCHALHDEHPKTNVLFSACPLGDRDMLKRFLASACGPKGLRRLDGVVHTASVSPTAPAMHKMSTATHDEIAANMTNASAVLAAAIHQLLLQAETATTAAPEGGCSIVMLAHVAAADKERSAVYDASSAFISSLARSAARDYGTHDIRVNTINVGKIEKSSLSDRFFLGEADIQDVPLARAGKLSECTSTIAWLLGPDSSFITGQEISIDGGARAK